MSKGTLNTKLPNISVTIFLDENHHPLQISEISNRILSEVYTGLYSSIAMDIPMTWNDTIVRSPMRYLYYSQEVLSNDTYKFISQVHNISEELPPMQPLIPTSSTSHSTESIYLKERQLYNSIRKEILNEKTDIQKEKLTNHLLSTTKPNIIETLQKFQQDIENTQDIPKEKYNLKQSLLKQIATITDDTNSGLTKASLSQKSSIELSDMLSVDILSLHQSDEGIQDSLYFKLYSIEELTHQLIDPVTYNTITEQDILKSFKKIKESINKKKSINKTSKRIVN